jgi:hypothetical protein
VYEGVALTTRNARISLVIWVFALIILLPGMLWANVQIASLDPRDDAFITYWAGTRAFLIDGASPYSDTVTLAVQELVYGQPASAGQHPIRVTYPFYSSLLFLPLAVVGDYVLARAIWMLFLELALVGIALTSLRLTGWRPTIWMSPIFFALVFFWHPSLVSLLNGNSVILVALFSVLCFSAICSGRDELAGICLAWCAIQPRPVILLLGFVIFWAITCRRWVLVAWFFGSLAALTVLSIFLVPDWVLQYLRVLVNHPEYPLPATPMSALATWLPGAGRQIGMALTLILALVLLAEWWQARGRDLRWFLWTASLTLVINQWINIPTSPANFVLLLFPVILVFACWDERGNLPGRLITLLSMAGMVIGLWLIYFRLLRTAEWPAQPAGLLFPLPLFLLIGLYWVRWWAIRLPRLFVEDLRVRE